MWRTVISSAVSPIHHSLTHLAQEEEGRWHPGLLPQRQDRGLRDRRPGDGAPEGLACQLQSMQSRCEGARGPGPPPWAAPPLDGRKAAPPPGKRGCRERERAGLPFNPPPPSQEEISPEDEAVLAAGGSRRWTSFMEARGLEARRRWS